MENTNSFLIKNQDETNFDLTNLAKTHVFDRGFQKLNTEIPSSKSELTIPPIEFYEKIILNYDNNDVNGLKTDLDEFSKYLYKNGFDDVDEFYNTRMEEVLINLCGASDAQLAQSAFFIVSLLQSKGPAYPETFLNSNFFNFCVKFIDNTFSAVLYYSLVCIYNICSQSEEARNLVMHEIPIEKLSKLMTTHFDPCVKEASLDLICCYTKFQVDHETCKNLISIAAQGLSMEDTSMHHSCFYILNRILRNYPDLTGDIMTPEILSYATSITDDEDQYHIIPGLIFISYVYEMNFEVPNLSINGLLEIFGNPSDHTCLRQALNTLSKIVYRRPDLIPRFISAGIFIQSAYAIEFAKYVDKVKIGKFVCSIIIQDIPGSCERMLQTKSVSFLLDLIDIDDEELTIQVLHCLIAVFEEAVSLERVDELQKRFTQNDGPDIINKLENEENQDIAQLANNFKSKFMQENEE